MPLWDAYGELSTLSNQHHRIRVAAPPSEVQGLARLAYACGQEFWRRIPPETDPEELPWLAVVVTPNAHASQAPPRRSRTLVLTGQEGLSYAVHSIMRHLIARHLDEPVDAVAAELGRRDWLAAALAFPVRYAADGCDIAGNPRYDCLRARVERGALPAPDSILRACVPPQQELPYRLFALHCRLLADVVELRCERHPVPLRHMLALLAHGRPPKKALETMAAESMSDEETLSEWFRRGARAVLRRTPSSLSAARFREELQAAETLNGATQVEAGEGEPSPVPIEDAAAILRARAAREHAAARLEERFNRLIRLSPPLVRAPLIDYTKAFHHLRKARKRRYARSVQKAAAEVRTALRRTEELEELLHSVQAKESGLGSLFPFHFHAVREWGKADAGLAPELERLLEQAAGG